MVAEKLDLKMESTRFTYVRGAGFPVHIQVRGRPFVCGTHTGTAFVSLTETEVVALSNFLTDALVEMGVPDGA